MKKVFFVIALAFVFSLSHAQVKFGLKAGANTASFKFDDVDSPDALLTQAKQAQWGFHAGAFIRINILMIYLQPEAYFTSTGGKFTYEDPNNPSAGEVIKSFDMNRLDIPILIGVKLGPVRINAGPAGHLVLSHKNDLEGLEADLKGMKWGYQAGLGFDLFKKLTFDVRYEGNLSKLGESVTIGGTDFATDMRTSQVLISVGFMF